ncbi:MAG: hypothetical protein WDZ52_06960 [Pseudohongiellaceae bacterium]
MPDPVWYAALACWLISNDEDASEEGKPCPVEGGLLDHKTRKATDICDTPGNYHDAVNSADDLSLGGLVDKEVAENSITHKQAARRQETVETAKQQ